MISEYLLSLLPPSTAAPPQDSEPIIQAVSAIIDIYSDETLPYDVNFHHGDYLERLTNSVEGIKKVVKAIDRRKDGGKELKRRGDEIKENLLEFIKYRRALRL
jgi:hypothetical protein